MFAYKHLCDLRKSVVLGVFQIKIQRKSKDIIKIQKKSKDIMDRVTKTRILAIFIVGMFVVSSVGIFFTGAPSTPESQPKITQTSPIVDGELDTETESFYIQRGFTILKIYSESFPSYVDSLPDNFRTPSGQIQLIVEKIQSADRRAVVFNIGNNIGLDSENLTQESVLTSLCNVLLSTPPECILKNVS